MVIAWKVIFIGQNHGFVVYLLWSFCKVTSLLSPAATLFGDGFLLAVILSPPREFRSSMMTWPSRSCQGGTVEAKKGSNKSPSEKQLGFVKKGFQYLATLDTNLVWLLNLYNYDDYSYALVRALKSIRKVLQNSSLDVFLFSNMWSPCWLSPPNFSLPLGHSEHCDIEFGGVKGADKAKFCRVPTRWH